MVSLLVAGVLSLARPVSFYSHGPYDPAIPKPETVLHYEPGERHSNFRDQERVMMAISEAAKNRVKVIQYGQTAEGRPLRIYIVGTPENMARLSQIQAAHQDLAHGKGDPAETVPIVWINECIHGDETASFESAMWAFYNLVATRGGDLADALKNEIVIMNPSYNPDGHERYVVYYNSIATGSDDPNAYEDREPSIIYGRLNHFRFDMNRDRVAFSQDETRAEFAEMLRWNPQVYIDQHGQVGSYFFPPEPMSINVNVDRERNAKWTNIFGRATGKAFDSLGLSYYTKDEFDLYYPGYLDASNTLSGAIGMTHETDGGRLLASRRSDGSRLTLRQGMEKHFTSALAVVEAAAANRTDLLADYAKFKKRACSGEAAGKFQRVVMTSADPRPLKRIQEQLGYAGIASYFAEPFQQVGAHDYWSGSTATVQFKGSILVVDMAQPQGAFAKALLEPGSDFEPEFFKAQVGKKKTAPDGEHYPGPESTEFYDFTGWAIPLAHDVSAWWCESAPKLSETKPSSWSRERISPSPVGYALRYTDDDDILTVFEALQSGVRGMVSTTPMRLGGVSYPGGTFLFMAGRNDDGYEAKLEKIGNERHVHFEPLTTTFPDIERDGPGSGSVRSLKSPSIAVVMGTGDQMAESGAMWFLMEREFKLPFSPISGSALNSADLGRYTCIVVPGGASLPANDRVRNWISKGNVAISLGGGLAFGSLDDVKGDFQDLPGSLFLAQIDPRSFLGYGYDGTRLAVPVDGSHFYQRKKEGGTEVFLSPDEKAKKLLTGWEWPDETEKALTNTAYVQDEPEGEGHYIYFAHDPTERAMWPGMYKMLLNAMLIGSVGG